MIEKISDCFNRITSSPIKIAVFILGVIALALVFYFFIKFLFENNSRTLIWAFVGITVVFALVIAVMENIDKMIFIFIPILFIIITCVLYSVEIKRIIWDATLGETKHGEKHVYDDEKIDNCISEIIKALQHMSKNDIGAIIILSNGNLPPAIIESGVKLDSDISSELIESVFFPKTPLHDGAMVINDTKIVASGCFLPLSQKLNNIPKDLGTRHRAGIGVTETVDVVSLIVSEETGIISIAKGGKITRYADAETLQKTLKEYYWQENQGRR